METIAFKAFWCLSLNGRIISQSIRMEHDGVEFNLSTTKAIDESVEEKEVIGHTRLDSKSGLYG